jgi:hypothetical protein
MRTGAALARQGPVGWHSGSNSFSNACTCVMPRYAKSNPSLYASMHACVLLYAASTSLPAAAQRVAVGAPCTRVSNATAVLAAISAISLGQSALKTCIDAKSTRCAAYA